MLRARWLLSILLAGLAAGPSGADEVATEPSPSGRTEPSAVPEGPAAQPSAFEDAVRSVKGAHSGLVRTLAFHPGGSHLATGGSDRALRIWEPEAEKPRAELILPRSG